MIKESSRTIRVYFLGSDSIAVPTVSSLEAAESIQLLGCYSQPDRAQGRRRQPLSTAVAAYCEAHGIEVRKNAMINAPEVLHYLTALDLDLIVVFAFGQILAGSLLKLPKYACVNIHPSLLPRYRGASPIAATLMNGDQDSGISIFQMVRKMDAGPIYKQASFPLTGTETRPELQQRLGRQAAEMIVPTIVDIVEGKLKASAQDENQSSYVGQLKKMDVQIDWDQSAVQIERKVRAYYPWPGAWFILDLAKRQLRLIVTKASVEQGYHTYPPGTIVPFTNGSFKIACKEGVLLIERLIPGGKREMAAAEFLHGHSLSKGSISYKSSF